MCIRDSFSSVQTVQMTVFEKGSDENRGRLKAHVSTAQFADATASVSRQVYAARCHQVSTAGGPTPTAEARPPPPQPRGRWSAAKPGSSGAELGDAASAAVVERRDVGAVSSGLCRQSAAAAAADAGVMTSTADDDDVPLC